MAGAGRLPHREEAGVGRGYGGENDRAEDGTPCVVAGWSHVEAVPEIHRGTGDSIGSEEGRTLRAGLFARYEWLGGEISASGGLASDDSAVRRTPYGGLVYLKRY